MFLLLSKSFREPPQEEKKKTVMDEGEFEAAMDEKPAKTEAEIMQWLQSLFLFSLCWSIGGNLDTDSRLKFSDFLKVLETGTNKQHQRFVLATKPVTKKENKPDKHQFDLQVLGTNFRKKGTALELCAIYYSSETCLR